MIDTLLFDFDGTIICTDRVVTESFRHCLSFYGVSDVPTQRITDTFGALIYDAVDGFIAEYNLPCTTEEFLTEYRRYHDECFFSYSYIFDGIVELLKNLKEKGLKIALVTTRRKRSTHLAIDHYDVSKYFDYVLTSEDCAYIKPDPRVIDVALDAIHSSRDRAIIIGDSHYDVECGRNASIPTVFAGWCRELGLDAVANMQATYVAYTPLELLDIIK